MKFTNTYVGTFRRVHLQSNPSIHHFQASCWQTQTPDYRMIIILKVPKGLFVSLFSGLDKFCIKYFLLYGLIATKKIMYRICERQNSRRYVIVTFLKPYNFFIIRNSGDQKEVLYALHTSHRTLEYYLPPKSSMNLLSTVQRRN